MLVQRLSAAASMPVRASSGAAGFDLAAAHDAVVPPRGSAVVRTDLAVRVPDGTYGRVAPRSGLAVRHGIDVGAGVIDSDFRGNLSVVLFNHSDVPFVAPSGSRVAQLIIEKIETPDVLETQLLGETERGAGGFGSTGV